MPSVRKTGVTILWIGPTLLFAYILTVGSLLAGHASWEAIRGPQNDWMFGLVGFTVIAVAWTIAITKMLRLNKVTDAFFLPNLSRALGTGAIIIVPAIVASFIFG